MPIFFEWKNIRRYKELIYSDTLIQDDLERDCWEKQLDSLERYHELR